MPALRFQSIRSHVSRDSSNYRSQSLAMFRPASRAILRTTRAPCASTFVAGPASRRLVSTAAPETGKSRSWKNTAVRLGLAAGAVYYYNTSDILSDERNFTFRQRDPANYHPQEDVNVPTIESIKPRIREEREREAALYGERTKSPQDLESEAGQEGAFNPETGEINWDCPCLGGMAKGPCGEAFKAAFSCFVYSNEEPKGIDCIEKFKGMQDCFRQYPEVYGSELEDDEAPEQEQQQQLTGEIPTTGEVATAAQIDAASQPQEKRERAKQAKADMTSATARDGETAESDELIPKAWHDTNEKNEGETKAQKSEK